MLDLSPIEIWHPVLFLILFTVSYALFGRKAKQSVARPPYVGFWLLVVIVVAASFFISNATLRNGLIFAAIVIAVVGRLDEVRPISPRWQLLWQVIIAAILVVSGWTIPYVSNPFAEGIIYLDWITLGTLIFPGSILAALWLVFFMNAINWLDGVDGLAGGVAVIAAAALAAISLLPSTQDAHTLTLALLVAAPLVAFIIWNFPPARVYLGTIGSWFIGLYIALVAMQGGGKIITALLVLALPVLDLLFVILHRLLRGRMPWQRDTISHLHHRLLSVGIPARTITLAAMAVTSSLAVVGVLVPTYAKLVVFGVLAVGFLVALVRVLWKDKLFAN